MRSEGGGGMQATGAGARLALKLARLLLPGALRECVAGDLMELYTLRRVSAGGLRAATWLWWQVLTMRYVALHRGARAARGSHRDGSGVSLFGMGQDLRWAARALGRQPGFSAVVVVTLALGIGATSLMFSVVNGVLLRPLPYPEAERVVHVWQVAEGWRDASNPMLRRMADRFPASFPLFRDVQGASRSFVALGAYSDRGRMTLSGGAHPETVAAVYVTAEVFEALAVPAALGRVFTAEEDRVGGPALAVLADGFWRSRFGADAGVVGRTVLLDERPYTVVGVMPRGFSFAGDQLWVTFANAARTRQRGTQFLKLIGRLDRGVDLETARAEVGDVMRRVAEANPEEKERQGVRVIPRLEEVAGEVRPALLLLLAGAGVVLLIACANVTNLLLVRATSRRRELALRSALGARTGRVVQSLLAEGLLLAGAGGALGVLLAWSGLQPLVSMLPASIPRTGEVTADWRVAAFAAACTLGCALLASALPAFRAASRAQGDTLREHGRGAVGTRTGARTQGSLVVAEVALAFVLLAGAGLLVRSLLHLLSVNAGFERENVVVVPLSPPASRFEGDEQLVAYHEELLARVRAIPGVQEAAITSDAPFAGGLASGSVSVEHAAQQDDSPNVEQGVAGVGYFEVLRIRVLEGRAFMPSDRNGSQPVAVVSESFARRHFPGESALGRRIKNGALDSEHPWQTIVGVVADVRYQGLHNPAHPKMYSAFAQRPETSQIVLLRTGAEADRVLAEVREAIWSVNADVPIARVALMQDLVAESIADPRFRVLLAGLLGTLAAVLSMAGIYGVMAYSVARRTAELGVRLALGARPRRLLRDVVSRGARLTAIGVALGLPVALAGGRVLERFLFQVRPADPLVLCGIAALLLAVGVLAALVPGMRAARVDPLQALRSD